MNSLPLVSIIVPVYNAEETLKRSLESLKAQTYQHIEVILINDCSIDNSLDALNEFADEIDSLSAFKCKVISHKRNQGVSAARNTGLFYATGEFICYVDADDSMESDAIEQCVRESLQSGADIVYFHWWLCFNEHARILKQPFCASPLDAINAMLAGTMRWNLWLFMVRRELYEVNKIRFIPDANMGEDLLVTIKLLVHAKKISLLDQALYHYKKDNSESLTQIYSLRHMREVETNINETDDYLKNSRYSSDIGLGIDFLKLNVKLPLLVTGRKEDYMRWRNWFNRSNVYVMKNKQLPLRTRLLQWSASKRQYWVIRIYYLVVLRFVYGILYK